MKSKNRTAWGPLLALAIFLPMTSAQAGILGTAHDFSAKGWNTGTTFSQEICVVCHVPHNGRGALASPVGLLWNRDITSSVFDPYTSPTLKFVPGQPDGASKLCLSCHDGTIAIDRFGMNDGGAQFMTGSKNLGVDLKNDHPVSFVFDSALSVAVGTLKDPSVADSGLGGTIQNRMLRANKVQCVSCHNPHNPANNQKFLVKSNNNSALCLTCHNFGS